MMMKRFALSLAIATALATSAVVDAIAAGPADSQDSSVRVVVKYTGKGPVDETHRVCRGSRACASPTTRDRKPSSSIPERPFCAGGSWISFY